MTDTVCQYGLLSFGAHYHECKCVAVSPGLLAWKKNCPEICGCVFNANNDNVQCSKSYPRACTMSFSLIIAVFKNTTNWGFLTVKDY